MDFLKELFGEEPLTFEQFLSKVNEKGLKLADLSTGNYVAKKKYDDEVSAKDTAIEDLKGQLKTRDDDIKDLKTKLSADGDNETKITDLTAQLEKLQGDYSTAQKDYEAKLKQQGYEFAVREFAGNQKFTSQAAKRDFISEMIKENLKMKDNTIVGADDFMKLYSENNADAFVVEEPEPAPTEDPKPQFVAPTTPQQAPGEDNPFISAFNFAGVLPH